MQLVYRLFPLRRGRDSVERPDSNCPCLMAAIARWCWSARRIRRWCYTSFTIPSMCGSARPFTQRFQIIVRPQVLAGIGLGEVAALLRQPKDLDAPPAVPLLQHDPLRLGELLVRECPGAPARRTDCA